MWRIVLIHVQSLISRAKWRLWLWSGLVHCPLHNVWFWPWGCCPMSTRYQREEARKAEAARPPGRWVDVRCFHCGRLLARVRSMVEAKNLRIKCRYCHVVYPAKTTPDGGQKPLTGRP